MFVSRHKGSKAGPAPLTLSANLKSYLDVYVKHIRPAFVTEGEEALFVTNSGVAFSPGTIGKRITEVLGKGNISKHEAAENALVQPAHGQCC